MSKQQSLAKQQWLISWIGSADLDASEGKKDAGIGPVATALLEFKGRFDHVYLLTNYDFKISKTYCSWLNKKTGYKPSQVDLCAIDLSSPINYGEIYDQVSRNLLKAGLPNHDVELTFHTSPGTPAMAAIWIVLAKTRFPAKLIQTSRENGLATVDFNFDLANDFLPEYLQRVGDRAQRLANATEAQNPEFNKIITKCTLVRTQISLAKRIAAYEVPVLVLGETGTGKELFAEAIHAASTRADQPFIAVNCGAIAPELANSELFGHKKGSFTGASSDRKGYFVEASGGTLFLDEIGDLPLDSQVRLLRALQSQEIIPVGQSKPIKVNTRVLAATHKDLASEVLAGRFREDLYHRLAVGIIKLPPLRDRAGDIGILASHFLTLINADSQGKPEAQHKSLNKGAMEVLCSYSWPGNIRELYHTILRAVIWSQTFEITGKDIQDALLPQARPVSGDHWQTLSKDFNLQDFLDQTAVKYISQALKQTGFRTTAAANLLGFTNHQTLANWIKRLGMSIAEKKDR